MSLRPSCFTHNSLFTALGFALLALLVLPASGCGRSNLDDYFVGDGGIPRDSGNDVIVTDGQTPESGACNATTCPSGCCDATGKCQAGSSLTACGKFGESCANCTTEGFQLCDPTRHACGNTVATCDPSSCQGCCEGNECFAGTDPNECGINGEACLHCEASSLACTDQQCVQPACGPETCKGCCFGEDCISGSDQTACGTGGEVCLNCTANGGTCTAGVCQGQSACNASNCQGCCIGAVCLDGTDQDACGTGGETCSNCEAKGDACIPETESGGSCQSQGPCSPMNCPGCCANNTGDPAGVCVQGNSSTQCGGGGQACQDCTQSGEQCVSQGPGGGFCQNAACNPTNCAGCCQGNDCVPGTSATACGLGGEACVDCSASGETCSGADAGFGTCSGPPPVCNAQTCPDGCCDSAANCLPGNLDSFCGKGGASCTNCGASDESCKSQACAAGPPSCNASNCKGCCDSSNTCQPGFIDTQCGGAGASCEDCTEIVPASTCDVDVTPPTCQSQQVQCPAPYPSCPGSIETTSPTQQKVCSASDLSNAGEACEGGAHSTACNAFFTFEQGQNPACASCLSAFDYDFSELTGLTTCVAPFVDAACNHITGCLVDCTDKACAQCADADALQLCQNEVPNSTCETYYNGAQCIETAFAGPGGFCDPNQGTGQFGDWLQQVGQNYCGQ